MHSFFNKVSDLLNSSTPFVLVTVVDTTGSVPQDAGSKMLVTENGLYAGTVGGGKVEARAIKEAISLLQSPISYRGHALNHTDDTAVHEGNNTVLAGESGNGSKDNGKNVDGETHADADADKDAASGTSMSRRRRHNPPSTRFFSWSLSKDIGMTCGGSLRIFMEAFNLSPWRIVIFGAGHISCAVTGILKQLDCQVTCYDTRAEWLAKLPEAKNIRKVLVESLPEQVKDLRAGDAVCLMSMGHSTDMPVLLEILKRNLESTFSYLGVIGSAAKAARLHKDILEAGLPEHKLHAFCCPMGLPIGSNHPGEIAISISAQLLQVRDRDLQLHQNVCRHEQKIDSVALS